AIYGKETRDPDREIEFESEVLTTTDFKTTYKASNDPVGQMYISASGHEGMTAKLWKIVTVNGEEKERVEVNETEYQPQNTVINVGIAGTATQATMISRAIQTQDEATIRKTIAQVR
ncbi:MAG: G5 domain-containing protein, partial [Lachnospiraceae bacterium]|nr:G5 domain-containing protein [Lachnospiraceae bacterium]